MAEEDIVATIRADLTAFQAPCARWCRRCSAPASKPPNRSARISGGLTQAEKDAKAFAAAMAQASKTAYEGTQKSAQGLGALTQTFKGVSGAAAAFGVTLGAVGLATFAKTALDASQELIGLQNGFKAIAGSATQATATLTMLRAES